MSGFKPMLACSAIPELTEIRYPVMASPKLDGIRCLIIDGVPHTRNLKEIPNRYIRETIKSWGVTGLDGEIMMNGDFNYVQSVVMSHQHPDEAKFEYHVFDSFLDLKGRFFDRYGTACFAVNGCKDERVKLVPQDALNTPEQLAEYWARCVQEGYEGVIIRDPKGPYKWGRSTPKQGWMSKLKHFHDDEAVVIDFEELMHNNDTSSKKLENMVPGNTLGALIVQWQDKTFSIGSGFNQAQRSLIWQNRAKYKGSKVTFKYQELSVYGIPRFPVFKSVRVEGA